MGRSGQAAAVALTSFVGRRSDLRAARRLLGCSRLVSLVGPGGVGKTRLARQLADEVDRAFPDGTFVIELAEIRDPEVIVTELATSLGVEDVGRSPHTSVASFLRSRHLLLVLDNCEHLAADVARIVLQLLRESAALSVLVTSRQPLGVPGEQLFSVEPLSLPVQEGHGHVRAADSEAVELFVERARLVDPTFTLTDANTALVAQLCTTLDGIPLAIELAAARLRMLSLAQLAERLHDRFGVLCVAAPTALPHHQTLRASVDWSFEHCSLDEQRLWSWMSVFEGGCDLDAVEAVCAGTGINVFEAVAGLVDKSVLTPSESAGRVRYRMLDTIRAYGRDRLAECGDTLTEEHRAYFVGLARTAGRSWFGPGQRDIMARTAADHANLRAAFEACLRSSTAEATQDALEICTSIWWFWVGHGALDELVRWLCRALDQAAGHPATPVTLHALSRTAFVGAMRGDHTLVATYAQRALALVVDDEPQVRWDRRWARTLLDALEGDLPVDGDPRDPSELNLATLLDDPPPEPQGMQETVNVLGALAQARWWTGRAAEALELVDHAIEICRHHDDEWSLSFFLCLRGARLTDLGRHEQALDALREALRLGRGGFHGWTVVHALEFSARAFSALGQGAPAAVLLGALTSLWPDIGGVLLRSDQPRHSVLERDARQMLGPREFTKAFAHGRQLDLESVIAYVLDEEPPASQREAADARGDAADLTRRELEVAELVARGLSNKEIAGALVLSPRTAEGHVARLLDKLGFESRARVASWVAERRADGAWPGPSAQE